MNWRKVLGEFTVGIKVSAGGADVEIGFVFLPIWVPPWRFFRMSSAEGDEILHVGFWPFAVLASWPTRIDLTEAA